jgi:hypothetical protein
LLRRLIRGLSVARALVLAALPLSCARCDPAAPGPKPRATTAAPVMRSGQVTSLSATLEAARHGGKSQIPYVVPRGDEAAAYGAWVRAAAEAAQRGGPPPSAPPGFALGQIAGESALWVLRELPDSRRGAGAITLRVGAASAWVVEAPHTFFDVGTLPVAIDAFDGGRARALLVNTVHRYRARDAGEQEGSEGAEAPVVVESDVAHAPISFFLAAHEALVASLPGAVTLQLHGFKDSAAPGALAIVSAAGTPAAITPFAQRMRGVLGEDAIATYPDQVKVLGGTKNVEAQASSRAGAGFIHVEMARTLRDRLGADAPLRLRLGEAMLGR